MKSLSSRMILVAVVAFALLGGSAAALAGGDGLPGVEDESADRINEDRAEGPDVAITGSDLETATRVALEFLGEGRVTDTEIEDEESYYEVEVTLDDGRQVDVQLDEEFSVVGLD